MVNPNSVIKRQSSLFYGEGVMQTFSIFFLFVLFHWVVATPVSAQWKKVRFSTTGISISELPFKVAQLKGFWREEGLDVETILIRGAVGMQALLGGSVDYTSASGSTIAAAVRGLPVKLVFISSSKPQFELMSQPQIKSVQDLKGKIVGISFRGGSNDLMSQMILQKNGLAPNKDVTRIIVGARKNRSLPFELGLLRRARSLGRGIELWYAKSHLR
jgi:ABC-type nitrate/sulfonate/bicarbonate transport system substrate-binding protein